MLFFNFFFVLNIEKIKKNISWKDRGEKRTFFGNKKIQLNMVNTDHYIILSYFILQGLVHLL